MSGPLEGVRVIDLTGTVLDLKHGPANTLDVLMADDHPAETGFSAAEIASLGAA